ncbi:hypothetical protein Z043_123479 [Scleropages formosus]|uniref:G-protein coupled receptors family 1 profile domain-containing protein n=1 Tax=Scleropages formosus TaxID=113540 RepID=A0A0P7W7J8_SCLFO|nr:hypothetical protein Z043_123479 [Scleropages formosus]
MTLTGYGTRLYEACMNGSNPPSLQLVNNATSSPSNMESCPIEPQHLSITVFLCFVFLGGFLLNGFSLWVFCCRISKWSSGNILQFHLAMSDAIIAPAAPLIGVYFAMGQWTLGPFLCQLKIALITIHFYGSILFLMLISIHRYVAVVHYKKSTPMQQTKFVHKLCGGVWLLLLTSGSATFVLFHDSQVGNHTFESCGKAMGKLQEFGISFTNNKTVYSPGESISGSVRIVLGQPLQCKVLQLLSSVYQLLILSNKAADCDDDDELCTPRHPSQARAGIPGTSSDARRQHRLEASRVSVLLVYEEFIALALCCKKLL